MGVSNERWNSSLVLKFMYSYIVSGAAASASSALT
jgi:hypothetical protein